MRNGIAPVVRAVFPVAYADASRLPSGTQILRYYSDSFERHCGAPRGRLWRSGARICSGIRNDAAEAVDVTRHSRGVTLVTDLSRATMSCDNHCRGRKRSACRKILSFGGWCVYDICRPRV